MNVLVDTPIWSLLLRRKHVSPGDSVEISKLIVADRAQLLGQVRQELLSGINQEAQFARVRTFLRPFDDFPVTTEHYETAAQFSNICRKKGIQGSNVDFLICAVSAVSDMLIYSTDRDFENYARHLPIALFAPGN